jgi:hypothetical protein
MEADRAFSQAARERTRAAFVRRLRRQCLECSRLPVLDATATRTRRAGVREIPLDAIRGTTEPNRAAQFDYDFRPSAITRERWERVWLAEQSGTTLPPISVVPVGDAYAIRDGHHRVSVARARGASTIRAIVSG